MAKRRVHLTLDGALADQPVVWTMSEEFDLAFSIRQADLDDGVGWLMLELEGEEDRIAAALRWLDAQGVVVAPIEQDILAG
jgi:hypothetical protein